MTWRDKTKINLYGAYIIRKQEMLLCSKWKVERMEGKAHTACAEGYEGEWKKFIMLLWFQYFKQPSLFSEDMRVKQCENI